MAWLGNFSSGYREVFNAIFAPEWMHWVMHATLYAGLAILLMQIFNLQFNRRTIVFVLGMALFVGIIQEGIQLFSTVQIISWNSVFDLGVDLAGAGIGLIVLGASKKSRG